MAMQLPRRKFLHLVAGAAVLPTGSRFGWAQSYPTKPVRWIVPIAPGGPNDILARVMCQWLSERLVQPFVVEHRPGGGSNTGTAAVVNAPADGYTLLTVATVAAINATLYQNLSFNLIRDISPIARIISVSNAILVHPSIPATTIPEFIAYAKANPGKVNVASAGVGTSGHLSGELLKMMTDIDVVHVPYRGAAPALTDLLGGQVDAYIGATPTLVEYVRTGKLRALAVTTTTRSEALPDTPTVDEFVPGYEASAWFGVGAPKKTPAEIVDRLNKEINAALVDPRIRAALADMGGTVLLGSPADFGKLIADEIEKWAKVVKFSGAKAD
jgi:tripartite-type tricarboxylate transporter receptor subunit TctC